VGLRSRRGLVWLSMAGINLLIGSTYVYVRYHC
jgi:hypothetical protein